MKKTLWILVAIAILLALLFTGIVHADRVEKITWCHCEPNGNCQTLELPQQALENAGHVNAQGNPLHAGDHAGACVAPSETPTPSLACSEYQVCITPTEEATPSATPTEEATPSATPTQGPTATPGASKSEGSQVPTGTYNTSQTGWK